jgi:FemAB-related protein (PEP-CTERM system-associated)
MNAPVVISREELRLADLSDANEAARIERFVAEHPEGTVFHQPRWLQAVADGTGNRALALVAERRGEICAWLPLSEVHSPIFGRLLASSGFGVGGGVLALDAKAAATVIAAAEELAQRRSCPTIELRGGAMPEDREGWNVQAQSHCGFVRELAADDEAQLLAVPRKQRAEVRKGLDKDLTIHVGSGREDRDAHFAVYATSVRNLGTPVFPRALFDRVLDRFGEDADVLTVRHQGEPVAGALALPSRCGDALLGGRYMAGAGSARQRPDVFRADAPCPATRLCRFDFGRSKTESGAYHPSRRTGGSSRNR